LRSIGYVASSGSRVIVPNIVDLSTSAASSALSTAGLVLGTSTGSTSSGATSENNGYVASQSVASGADVERGTTVNYTTYSYTPPVSPPSWIDSTISNSFTQGTAYSDSVSATNGASYQIIQDNTCFGNVLSTYWVQGVTLDSGSGVLSGTPTSAGQEYSFKIRAYNSGGYVDSGSYCGTVQAPSGSLTSVSVTFNAVTSQTSLSGTASFINNTGATYSISLSTTAGSISPTSFVAGGYSGPGSPSVTDQNFTVTGLSAGQTAQVTASGGGASASSSATTQSGGGTPTYTFDSSYGGTGDLSCSGTTTSSGSVSSNGSSGITLTVNAGLCGSQSIYAFAPGTYYWLCCQT
jgi:hypothetical protein